MDYKKLSTSGERVIKVSRSPEAVNQLAESLENLTMAGEDEDPKLESKSDAAVSEKKSQDETICNQLYSMVVSLSMDIDDFVDENPVEDFGNSIEDMDSIIKRVEEMRSTFRNQYNQLELLMGQTYTQQLARNCDKKVVMLKEYIKHAKRRRKELRDGEDKALSKADLARVTKVNFLKSELIRNLTNLETVFKKKLTNETDEEIKKIKDGLPAQIKQVEAIPKAIQEAMDCGKDMAEIMKIERRYLLLLELQSTYNDALEKEVKQREIEKQKDFNRSTLNIKLAKFKGYTSSLDVYTFQDEFEKVNRKCPASLLPDLLKNNYLEGQPLSLVKDVKEIKEIWIRLKAAYGDCRFLLTKKLNEIDKIDDLRKHKDPSKTMEGIMKIINLMKDLIQLSKRHGIENKLYYGDGLEKICKLLGDNRVTRWLATACDLTEGEEQWDHLIEFLEQEMKVCQQKFLITSKSFESKQPGDGPSKGKTYHVDDAADDSSKEDSKRDGEMKSTQKTTCSICGEYGHVETNGPSGMKLIQYFVCKKFVEMSPEDRFQTLKSKGLCTQCLFPGAKWNKGKHKEGKCQRDYACQHPSHKRFPSKKHVLVCGEHKDNQSNQDLLKLYKERCILRPNQVELPSYSKDIRLSHHVKSVKDASTQNSKESYSNDQSCEANAMEDSAIYMLQTIKVDAKEYSIFYDSGCGDFVSRFSAVQRLGIRAKQENKGPITLCGVGGVKTQCPHGVYSVKLPNHEGADITLSGICIEQITEEFPIYPLSGEVEEDIRRGYHEAGGNLRNLPNLPKSVGGSTDFMLGIKYLRYFPEKVFQLPSGLAIYRSHFKNADGTFGVIGGPHRVFTGIEQRHHLCASTFIQTQLQQFRFGYQVNPDVTFLGFKNPTLAESFNDQDDTESQDKICHHVPRNLKSFNEAEEAGSEISFRCIKCRDCKECKNHDHIEAMSIKEEVEQDLIERSVDVDLERCVVEASLPLIADPQVKLVPNRHKALKVYQQQVKKLEKSPADRESVIKAENKLQMLGFVSYLKDLPEETQRSLKESPIQNYIPWRVVWKENSTTTPCRPVFDASQPTDSGFSLNDIVAKGRNNMNKLVEIFLRWRCYEFAYHNDIKTMYNRIKLREPFWCLQRYLWNAELDPSKEPDEKIIKTAIYGVTSSGNQAENGLRKTADKQKDEYPEVNEIVKKDVYVDDCMAGARSKILALKLIDDLELVLNKGGFTLKGFTMSGEDPDDSLTADGVSINVAGHKWYSKVDVIALDIKELNFARKQRGRKTKIIDEIPKNLTRRQCASKIAEIFDFTGIITPITATMKMDLHELCTRKLQWDDTVPDNLRPIWESHFQMISELKNLHYQRAVVPPDAADLQITTLDFGDASKSLVCIAIYVRFRRKCGSYSCQLIFGKSRVVPDGLSQPRAELYAALTNAHAGEVVRRSLYKFHKKSIKFTDSQIVLHWISNNQILKQWVRNRVVEIQRFTDPSSWRYIKSEDMIADIGTRRCQSIDTVKPDSTWIKGFDWMAGEETEFPMMTAEDIRLSNQEAQNMKMETQVIPSCIIPTYIAKEQKIINLLQERYQFSRYIIDPNRHKFSQVIRILALVMMYIRMMQRQSNGVLNRGYLNHVPESGNAVIIPDDKINEAKLYFSRKASSEVKEFLQPAAYQHISMEKDGILYYTGRILPEDDITIVGRATNVMKDLTSTSFCVPITDKDSPVAYSLVNDIHWYHPTAKHCGVETVLRYVLQQMHIIDGRSLVKKLTKSCKRCRYLYKKTLEVVMGPVSKYNLTIAPAYYISQVDLAGPFLAYCHHHKRNTIKIWLVVFCCATTSSTSIKTMEDYSTSAFIQAFTRFSCDVGYPKMLLCDEGSQLTKGCETMMLKFWDIKFKLKEEVGVEFDTCPVGGHNFHGKVERKIREIKKSLSKALDKKRLSILQWETLASTIANSINNLPLALVSNTSSIESLDLLTPNRLKLGRNNERSPEGSITVNSKLERIIKENESIFNSWFEIWLTAHVPLLMNQQKWFKSGRDLKVGDVVLFLKEESSKATSTYQFGIVLSVDVGRDDRVRMAVVKYRNHNEGVVRTTNRAARSLVIIHHVDEVDVMEELHEASTYIENLQSQQTNRNFLNVGECSGHDSEIRIVC